jgi:predicted nuclease of restriction endonuclease-like RecB superfamily
LLREGDLPLRLIGGQAFIDFVGPQDEPWLRVLLAEMNRFEGRRQRELAERLLEPLPCEAPHFKRRAASRVLLRLWRRRPEPAVPSREVRARLFTAATESDLPREALLAEAAAHFAVSEAILQESLFADLPVRAPQPLPSPNEIALRTNLAVAQALLMRASSVEIRALGAVRPIVRLAKLRGLLCVLVDHQRPGGSEPVLQISGPFSLFRHTLLYGRALAELLPHLSWCARFELKAACALRGRLVDITLESGDPFFPAGAPAPFDSRLEERFARDIGRRYPDWDVIREPEAVRAGATLIFPDFLLRHRVHVEREVLVEIAGFWTPAYLAAKLQRLRQAHLRRFILCIDEDRACNEGPLPDGLPTVRFRRRVDVDAVMRLAETLTGAPGDADRTPAAAVQVVQRGPSRPGT